MMKLYRLHHLSVDQIWSYDETVPAPSSKCRPNMVNLGCRN